MSNTAKEQEEFNKIKKAHAKGFLAFTTTVAGVSDADASKRYKEANAKADAQIPVIEKRASILKDMHDKILESKTA